MLIYSQKRRLGLLKGASYLHLTTFDPDGKAVEQWKALLLELGQSGARWHMRFPTDGWINHTGRINPVAAVLESSISLPEDAVPVPDTYFQFLCNVLKYELWLDAGAVPDERSRAYWYERLRWLLGQVRLREEWVADPELTFISNSSRAEAVKTINNWLENFDLRHRKRVKPSLPLTPEWIENQKLRAAKRNTPKLEPSSEEDTPAPAEQAPQQPSGPPPYVLQYHAAKLPERAGLRQNLTNAQLAGLKKYHKMDPLGAEDFFYG